MRYFLLSLSLLLAHSLQSQMKENGNTLFGNEWISDGKTYYKIKVWEDAIYHLDYNTLTNAGLTQINGRDIRLYKNGKEVPIIISNEGNWSESDYLTFIGQKNKSELDTYLFENGSEDITNTQASLFNDTSAYFLSVNPDELNLRTVIRPNDLTNLPSPEQVIRGFHEISFADKPADNSTPIGEVVLRHSQFTRGKGMISATSNPPINFSLEAITAGSESPVMTLKGVTNNGTPGIAHDIKFLLNGTDFGGIQGFGVIFHNKTNTDAQNLLGSANSLTFTPSYAADLFYPGYLSVEYNRSADINKEKTIFYLNGQDQEKYLVFRTQGLALANPILTDENGQWQQPGEVVGAEIRFKIPAFTGKQKFILYTNPGTQTKPITKIKQVVLNNYAALDAEYVIISADHLMKETFGPSAVAEYAAYRSSTEGGNYKVAVVNISDLENSFSYGVLFHPFSVRNFTNFISQKEKTRFLFLIGRGADYLLTRTSAQMNTAITSGYAIPSYGDIGSDNMLVSSDFTKLNMLMSIGRLPSKNQDEVRRYLTKIKSSDVAYNEDAQNAQRTWNKKTLQLNGGDLTKSDFNSIRTNHQTNQSLALKSKMAANVSYYAKNSSSTIETPIDQFFKELNDGAAFVDYYGHGSNNVLAYEIHFPDKYAAKPRLPFLFIRGCSTGNANLNGSTRADEVLYGSQYGENGFRAVIGSTTFSFVQKLSPIGTEFYNQYMNVSYGQTLGEIFKATMNHPQLNGYDESIQMQYSGDPALVVPTSSGPDYTILPTEASISPAVITEQDNAVTLNFTISNLGLNNGDRLAYRIIYLNPIKDTIQIINDTVFPVPNKLLIEHLISLDKTTSLGEHSIHIILDPENTIAELKAPNAELNNEYQSSQGNLGISFFVEAAGINPVYPVRYALIDTDTISLMAYSTELFDKTYTYFLSLDTTKDFNSPLLMQTAISSKPGHLEWKPNTNLIENTVYYWQIRRDSLNNMEKAQIASSSFTYIKGLSGFNQAHNGQFEENTNLRIKTVGGGNHLEFGTTAFPLLFKNGLVNNSNKATLGGFRDGRKSNGYAAQDHVFNLYPNGVFGISIFRKDSFLLDWRNINPYGSSPVNYAQGRNYLVYEPQNQESRIAMINTIENVAHEDDIIVIFTCVREDQSDFKVEEWAADSIVNNGANLFNLVEKYGGTKLRSFLTTGVKPYTIIFDKKLGLLVEQVAYSTELLDTEANIPRKADDGITKQTIGPARSWSKLEILKKDHQAFGDKLNLDLILHHKDNYLLNQYLHFTIDTFTKLFERNLDPELYKDYPYLTFELYSQDDLTYRGKLDGYHHIRFYADELPEATLLNDEALTFKSDTINQGEELEFSIRSKNIGRLTMDSMLVKFSIVNPDESITSQTRYIPLKPGEKDIYSFKSTVTNSSGNCLFTCEMNPSDDQLELFHNNNLYYKRFFVRGDVQNPLIDITFDGDHIFDGDIINWKPTIKVLIKDENKYQALDDSTLFDIDIFAGNDFSPIYTRYSPEVKFFPAVINANNQRNEAYFEIRPTFDSSGEYSIKVKARDIAGNSSGAEPLTKKFQVINEKSVSNLFNYPNPFSTATRFVYTLTGNELPTYYKIQIMSTSGKIIREITQNELGPLKIGKHMTDFVWNGTDQFGDKLANGVYLYRLVMKEQDQTNYKQYEISSTNKYFTGEWGKLVIIR